MNVSDVGLETLLELDGSVLEQEGAFWIKIDARQVPPSQHALHGIRYSLTLHDRFGTRVLGYDKGVPYVFESAQRLLEDFFAEVDRVIKEAQQ